MTYHCIQLFDLLILPCDLTWICKNILYYAISTLLDIKLCFCLQAIFVVCVHLFEGYITFIIMAITKKTMIYIYIYIYIYIIIISNYLIKKLKY